MQQSVIQAFSAAYRRDQSRYIRDWLVRWDYQVKRQRRKLKADGNEPENFFEYNGPDDLARWLNWLKEPSPHYLPASLLDPLTELSQSVDSKVFAKLGLDINWTNYRDNIDLMNAHDYVFPNLYPHPKRFAIRNILDFGAGYGRQANLWTNKLDAFTYVGMDAIPKSYCLQNLYYSSLDKPFFDYIEQPDLTVDFSTNAIYHIPTWRHDLLPDHSFDLVMCVQVLPELNSTLVRKMIAVFDRILKPGAMLYVLDHGVKWKPGGRMNIDQHIMDSGFVLEFRPHVIDDVEVHGIPRIYRKPHPDVVKSQAPTTRKMVRQELENLDAVLGGRLSKLSQAIRKSRNKGHAG